MRPLVEGRLLGIEPRLDLRLATSPDATREAFHTIEDWAVDETSILGDVAQYGLAGVTPEQVLMLLSRRLRNLDSQLRDLTAGMEMRNARIEAANVELSLLGDVRKAINSQKGREDIAMNSYGDESLMPGGLTVRDYLEQAGYSPEDLGLPSDGRVSLATIQTCEERINRDVNSINSENERTLIQFQTLVQQRSESVSLCTNVLKTLHDSASEIARNIG